jgi:hypothetical protein
MARGKQREYPPWLTGSAPGTRYIAIAIGYFPACFKLFAAFCAFVFVYWHTSYPLIKNTVDLHIARLPLRVKVYIVSMPAELAGQNFNHYA